MKNIYTTTTQNLNQEEMLNRLLSINNERKQNRAYFGKIFGAVAIIDVILFLIIY